MAPELKKAAAVVGKNIVLRNVEEDDAQFVLDLRTDAFKSRFLSETSRDIQDQVRWIRHYNIRNDQSYFIICDCLGEKLGCVRMYDPRERTYCWGSWLLMDGLSHLVAVESAVLVYSYGKYLGFEDVRLDVRQENTSVWRFHEKFSSAELVRETDLDRFYVVRKSRIEGLLRKYAPMVTSPLQVVGNAPG